MEVINSPPKNKAYFFKLNKEICMKKEIIVATAHIAEIDSVTGLILGGLNNSIENGRPMPYQKVALGKASSLTMGNGIGGYEGPGSQIRKVKSR